jgi:hypothetical protein
VLQTTRWDRITDTGPRQLPLLVDQALGMLAEDLLDRLEPALRDLGGEDWPQTLAELVTMPNRRAQELSPQDGTAYADLLRSQAQGWEPSRTQLRQVLMRGRPYFIVDPPRGRRDRRLRRSISRSEYGAALRRRHTAAVPSPDSPTAARPVEDAIFELLF